MNQFIGNLILSITQIKDTFDTIDIENIPKNSTIPTQEQFEILKTDLRKLSECYEQLCNMKKEAKQSKISEWVLISPTLTPILDKCPLNLLKKNTQYWMKKSDFFSVWSYWFRKENLLTKGILSNLPKELSDFLGKSELSWYEFMKVMYNQTEQDKNVSEAEVEKWKKWKKTLTEANEQIRKKPKKVKAKKQKPKKKMVPSKTKQV